MRAAVALAALLAAAAPAVAGEMWSEETVAPRGGEDYQTAMDSGDEATILAAGGALAPAKQKKKVLEAVRHYERAAAADGKAAEPHWRAASTLFGFFVDCEYDRDEAPLCTEHGDRKLLRRILDHWHAFEERAPMDPRVTDILFERAILHTHLATDDDLRAAVADYEAILDRIGQQTPDLHTVLANLAESHMMLGDVDAAIERYRDALQVRADAASSYGLAVAFDRDGQGGKAREIMKALGEDEFQRWQVKVAKGETFYVPQGEVYYYLALAHEALGRPKEARRAWKLFLDSGAHPEYQPRARENLRALDKKGK